MSGLEGDERQDITKRDPLDALDEMAIEPARGGRVDSNRPSGDRAPVVRLGAGRMVTMRPGTSIEVSHPAVDVCFVFDTTGSMSDKIDGLISCMTDFVDAFSQLALDWRCTCVPFGDLTVLGDRVDAQLPFVRDAEGAKAQLRRMPRFSGGGNLGESAIEAMLAGVGKPWRPGAVRILVLLTDEPALQATRASAVLEKLLHDEIVCFVASVREPYYQNWARRSGGQWFEIGPRMDTTALLELLRSLVRDVAKVAHDVHQLAAGSVRRYLELESGSRNPPDRR